jgi:N,N'-diacetyllegionaminate synthase
MPQVSFGGRTIGDGHPPFIIAEAGINHNGDVGHAAAMIRAAKDAGADAVKFQTFRAREFVADETQMFTYRSQGVEVTESMLAMFERYEFRPDQWREVKAACDAAGIMFLSTPQNRTDLDLLLELGVAAVKVGSDDFTNLPLLRSYAAARLPLILSCGMADLSEVHRSLETVGAFEGAPVILLLCTSEYPTPAPDVNLRKLITLRAAFPPVVLGFSDHTQGAIAAAVARGLGALVFEKHFTLDHDLPGPDHWFSEDPRGLRAWVDAIRTADTMLGSELVRPTATERANRKEFRRVVVAACAIAAGEPFGPHNLTMRRVAGGAGLEPAFFDRLLGVRAPRAFAAGDPIAL